MSSAHKSCIFFRFESSDLTDLSFFLRTIDSFLWPLIILFLKNHPHTPAILQASKLLLLQVLFLNSFQNPDSRSRQQKSCTFKATPNLLHEIHGASNFWKSWSQSGLGEKSSRSLSFGSFCRLCFSCGSGLTFRYCSFPFLPFSIRTPVYSSSASERIRHSVCFFECHSQDTPHSFKDWDYNSQKRSFPAFSLQNRVTIHSSAVFFLNACTPEHESFRS